MNSDCAQAPSLGKGSQCCLSGLIQVEVGQIGIFKLFTKPNECL